MISISTIGRSNTIGSLGTISVVAAAFALAIVLLVFGAREASAQSNLNVNVGVGDGTVAGNVYQTGDFTLGVGDAVTFVIASDEPHTITLGAGPEEVPPPFWPVSGFAAPEEGGPPPSDLGTASTDGTAFINTGILFGKGSSATVEFTAPGTFGFFCAIHPGMVGQVTVVEDGPVTSQADADAVAQETADSILAQVEPLREERAASTSSVQSDDGTTTWNLFADASTESTPQAGGGTGYLELLEFTPAQIEIAPGDTISWTADKIHTVTFVPEGMDPEELFPSEDAVFVPIAGSTFDGTAPVSSGVFNISLDPAVPPLTEYSLTFPEPGVYPFFCALHAELGQMGVVTVST